MVSDDEREVLAALGVRRPLIEWSAMKFAMATRSVRSEWVDAMEAGGGGVASAMIDLCRLYRDPMVEALREEDFGLQFAKALKLDPSAFGFEAGMGMDAQGSMLASLVGMALHGGDEHLRLAKSMGEALASLHWDLVNWDDGAEDVEGADAVVEAMLDFLPVRSHAGILDSMVAMLRRAREEGAEAFAAPAAEPEPLWEVRRGGAVFGAMDLSEDEEPFEMMEPSEEGEFHDYGGHEYDEYGT